jgi:hypothetical protein
MRAVPFYQRDKFIFISNLNEVTASHEHSITLKRDGYLLSEHYTTPKLEALAKWVKSRRNLLVSDNGNFTRMKKIAADFEESGEQLLHAALKEVEETGSMSASTFSSREALIQEVSNACKEALEAQNFTQIIEKQLVIEPDYIIGLEDFTIPVLIMIGLMHPVFQPQAASVTSFQQKTASLFADQIAGKFGRESSLTQTAPFVVLHAYDYESAFLGAQNSASAKAAGIAISYGGAMRSKRWCEHLKFGEIVETFEEKLPESYLLAAALTLGAANGLQSDAPIHILGVGTPIMIALIGHLLHRSRAVSIDSTAPFKDANVGTLYGSKHGFLKMDQYKVAAYALVDNRAYTSRTPFFKAFDNKFPSNWAALRAELGVSSSTNIKTLASALKNDHQALVEKHIPFFSRMRSGDDPMIQDLRVYRAGHNYWILRNIVAAVRQRIDNRSAIDQWTAYQVERYKAVASDKWGKAVEKVFEFSQKYAN